LSFDHGAEFPWGRITFYMSKFSMFRNQPTSLWAGMCSSIRIPGWVTGNDPAISHVRLIDRGSFAEVYEVLKADFHANFTVEKQSYGSSTRHRVVQID
jgi:hypothetical protein